jgi:drug/metabolite transporter (DMT)-like permease
MKTNRAFNLLGSSALFASNILVCIALFLLRHSADNAGTRTLYLLIANGLAGLLGFLPFRKENALRIDRPTMAVALWSACYCTEYGLFLAYPGVISLSQLIVCNCLAPFLAVYVSRDVQRSALNSIHRLLSIAPVFFLLGMSWLERQARQQRSFAHADLILLCVFLSVIISQSCARYVARHRSPSWSQPRLTILNALFLSVVLSVVHSQSKATIQFPFAVVFCVFAGVSVLLIQRLYIFGLTKADPFISAMALCTIVPLSLVTDMLFEHRTIGPLEICLAAGYVIATGLGVMSAS